MDYVNFDSASKQFLESQPKVIEGNFPLICLIQTQFFTDFIYEVIFK